MGGIPEYEKRTTVIVLRVKLENAKVNKDIRDVKINNFILALYIRGFPSFALSGSLSGAII